MFNSKRRYNFISIPILTRVVKSIEDILRYHEISFYTLNTLVSRKYVQVFKTNKCVTRPDLSEVPLSGVSFKCYRPNKYTMYLLIGHGQKQKSVQYVNLYKNKPVISFKTDGNNYSTFEHLFMNSSSSVNVVLTCQTGHLNSRGITQVQITSVFCNCIGINVR